jgi:hypothetical protein
VLAVLVGFSATPATADAPVRWVTFDATEIVTDSPFCPGDVIEIHDVGRITYTAFFNRDGTLKAFTTHDAAVTSYVEDTTTGAKLTVFYSNVVIQRNSIDSETGVITGTVSFDGLNFIIAGADGPPLVSAGRAVINFTVTFDSEGNPMVTETGGSATPRMLHFTQILCS